MATSSFPVSHFLLTPGSWLGLRSRPGLSFRSCFHGAGEWLHLFLWQMSGRSSFPVIIIFFGQRESNLRKLVRDEDRRQHKMNF